ncbi:tyrosinase-like protein isoform X1 [Mytilus californianus]|uniref:tyrosinase-like protein isoform X1 n=1 Tax=Mytilus californianus TaxID=6549 RepID=UPI0022458172|nr:tyrosinase-like protein isoform X1 [Mytilus californianus]
MILLLSSVVLSLHNVLVHSEITLEGYDPECTIQDEDEFDFYECNATFSSKYYCSLSLEQHNWLKSLWQEAIKDRSNKPRKRREIRVLSETERLTYFRAINRLKTDTTIAPNKYDTLAMVHTSRTMCSAHQGSNFLGWHRVYLLLYETALRQKDKSVVLPYWNSVLDNQNITDPKQTVLFTKDFLGNGNGNVTDGPFKYWRDIYNCPLNRNISRPGSELLSPEIVEWIENDNSVFLVEDIIDHLGSAERIKTIEGQHNLPHGWVGGMMGILSSSPKDPAFFLHHAYIDYIWEKFRQKQLRLGKDPEYYTGLGVSEWISESQNYNLTLFHNPHRNMDCFQWMKNIDGYSNNFTENLYVYEDSPTYPDCGNTKYLNWNTLLNRCIGINPVSSAVPQSIKPYYVHLIIIISVSFILLFIISFSVFLTLRKIKRVTIFTVSNEELKPLYRRSISNI